MLRTCSKPVKFCCEYALHRHYPTFQISTKSNPKAAQLLKKCAAPQEGHCEKRCEIQGGGQEMAVMVG